MPFQVIVTDKNGKEIASGTLNNPANYVTALYDATEKLVERIYGSTQQYLNDVEGFGASLRRDKSNTLSQVLNDQVKQAGGLSKVKQSGLPLIMPKVGGRVHIMITPL